MLVSKKKQSSNLVLDTYLTMEQLRHLKTQLLVVHLYGRYLKNLKKRTKQQQHFLAFLSRTDIQAKWHQDTGYLGVTTAAAKKTKSSGFYKSNPGTDLAGIQMMRNKVTQNSKGLRLGSFDQIRGIIDEEMEGVYNGTKTAQVALDSAVRRGNVLLRRFERANK